MDGGHVHSTEARERERDGGSARTAPAGRPLGADRTCARAHPRRPRGRPPPSRNCYKCTNPVYTPIIIGLDPALT
jgi:hypothetical protein